MAFAAPRVNRVDKVVDTFLFWPEISLRAKRFPVNLFDSLFLGRLQQFGQSFSLFRRPLLVQGMLFLIRHWSAGNHVITSLTIPNQYRP